MSSGLEVPGTRLGTDKIFKAGSFGTGFFFSSFRIFAIFTTAIYLAIGVSLSIISTVLFTTLIQSSSETVKVKKDSALISP